jgi:SAM-dependent methyltransferase
MKYAGTELEVFAYARNWKRYWAGRLRPFVAGDVLEVGAGAGANTALLWNERVTSVTCLEPDAELAARLGIPHPLPPPGARTLLAGEGVPREPRVIIGTTADLRELEAFDAVVYVDVLEHIEDDREELARAERLLRPGGYLAVVSPAYPLLFTEFDRAVGHYRRYTRRSLAAVAPAEMIRVRLHHLDSVGVLLSLGNRLLLRQAEPTRAQILAWDRYVVPASRCLDWLTAYRVGRSVLGVWRKPPEAPVREFGPGALVAA